MTFDSVPIGSLYRDAHGVEWRKTGTTTAEESKRPGTRYQWRRDESTTPIKESAQ